MPKAYVWGATNASVTSWTDTATTNNDGSTVTQRFYRVQRLLGSPIAAGGESSVALRQDGTLWAWGDSDGDLGDGLDSNMQRADGSYVEPYLPYPSDVANATSCGVQTITNAAVVAAGGDDYTVVVDATGTVWTFGENDQGQLGNESEQAYSGSMYPVPFPVSGPLGFTNVVSVAAGYQHTLALCANGSVWAWGSNQNGTDGTGNGQLGAGYLGGALSTNSPVQSRIPTGTFIVAIAAGNGFSLAVDTNGFVWGWGGNEVGEIGATPTPGRDASTNLPTLVAGISSVIAIAAGDNYAGVGGGGHSIALTADKRVWTWGDNGLGELGNGTTGGYDPAPTVVANLSNVVAIAGGVGFTLAVTSNGQVYAWGDNTFGELGTNTSAVASANHPMLVAGITNVVWVSAPRSDDGLGNVFTTNAYFGGVHAMAMTVNQGTNQYWGWGDNSYGSIGNVTNGGATNQISQYTPAGPLQFCTRCQRTVQLGTGGGSSVVTAQCNGTLYLYFNTDNFNAAGGSYNATFNSSNVTVLATNYAGIAVGPVTNGGVYSYSASGACLIKFADPDTATDPNGNATNTGMAWDCSEISVINIMNAPCPTAQCFSLVGKIQ